MKDKILTLNSNNIGSHHLPKAEYEIFWYEEIEMDSSELNHIYDILTNTTEGK